MKPALRRVLMAFAVMTGALVGVGASAVSGAMPPSGGIQVFVGYAAKKPTAPMPSQFPWPWVGSPGVTFVGCHPVSSCAYDGGTVRIVNGTRRAVTVDSVAVSVSTCTYNRWPSVRPAPMGTITKLAPGHQLILDQLSSHAGELSGCTGPTPEQMDTSDIGPGGENYDYDCTADNITPTVSVTVNNTSTTYQDTTQVLNTGGFDLGECPHGTNESHLWTALTS